MSDFAPHQLDRIEDMLKALVDAHPGLDANKIHKADVSRLVADLFGHMLGERKIEAIRNYRMLTGEGLKESKDIIERIMPFLPRRAA